MIVRHLSGPEARHWLVTGRGEASVSFVSGWVMAALEHTGAVRASAVLAVVERTPMAVTGDQVMACLERLVELGELAEVGCEGERMPVDVDRVFVRAPRRYGPDDGLEVTEDAPVPEGCTNPARDCARDSACPVHGKDRPGQGVATEGHRRCERCGSWMTLQGRCTGRDCPSLGVTVAPMNARRRAHLSKHLCGQCGSWTYADRECPLCDCTSPFRRRDLLRLVKALDEGYETLPALREQLGETDEKLEGLVARLVALELVEQLGDVVWRVKPPVKVDPEVTR